MKLRRVWIVRDPSDLSALMDDVVWEQELATSISVTRRSSLHSLRRLFGVATSPLDSAADGWFVACTP